MDMVRVKALRHFTEFVEGRGLVVFNGPRAANKELGKDARAGTEDELPENVAAERVRRGHAEALGKGAERINKSAAEKRNEKILAARAARRGQVIADGAMSGPTSEAEGEGTSALADDEAALREVQDAIANGDDLEPPVAVAEGGVTHGLDSADEQAATEPSSASADTVGDGATAVMPAGRIVAGDSGPEFSAFDQDGDGHPGGSKKGAESTSARGAAKRRGRPPTKKKATSGGETAVETDAPTE